MEIGNVDSYCLVTFAHKIEINKRSKDTMWIAHRFSSLGIQEDKHETISELLVKDSLEKMTTLKTVMFIACFLFG